MVAHLNYTDTLQRMQGSAGPPTWGGQKLYCRSNDLTVTLSIILHVLARAENNCDHITLVRTEQSAECALSPLKSTLTYGSICPNLSTFGRLRASKMTTSRYDIMEETAEPTARGRRPSSTITVGDCKQLRPLTIHYVQALHGDSRPIIVAAVNLSLTHVELQPIYTTDRLVGWLVGWDLAAFSAQLIQKDLRTDREAHREEAHPL